MSTKKNQPILVTGAPRSGTTWTGLMIAAHPRVMYFSEPLNIERKDLPVREPWHYITRADEELFRAYLRPYAELRFPWWDQRQDFPASLPRRLYRHLRFFRRRLVGYRPLLKDPMALMAAPWLASTYQAQVVVTIRHPASFASSLKRLNWWFSFDPLLSQPALMDDYQLHGFRDDIKRVESERHRSGRGNVIEEAILAWRVFHHVIQRFQERNPSWLFCRHEDLSQRPIEEFARIYDRLGLEFTPKVQQAILQHTDEENPAEAEGKVHQLKRNSKANIWNWLTRLTPEEIARIRAGTRGSADHFYGDANWWPQAAAA